MLQLFGKLLRTGLSVMFLLAASGLVGAELPKAFSAEMTGRLVWVFRGPQQGIFVLAGAAKNGVVPCRKMGVTRAFPMPSKDVTLLPFYEDVSPLVATQYALYAYAHGSRRGWEMQLAQQIGDTTGRMAMIAEFEIACNAFFKKLQAVPTRFGEDWTPDDYTDRVSELWIDSNPINDVIRKALAGEDRILSLALFEAYQAFIKENSKIFNATPSIAELCQETITALSVEQLENFTEYKKRPNPRQERFRKLFPRARSLWAEAPPSSFPALQKTFERSLQAFARLDDLSVVTEPEEWGSAMLDALLMTEGSPAGEELEKEFDAIIGNLEKNAKKNQAGEP